MKQTFLRLDTLIDVSGSCQKIKCPWDVWTLDGDCCFRTKNRFIFQTFITNLLDLKRNKSYDDSVKLKRTEMDHFRLG